MLASDKLELQEFLWRIRVNCVQKRAAEGAYLFLRDARLRDLFNSRWFQNWYAVAEAVFRHERSDVIRVYSSPSVKFATIRAFFGMVMDIVSR